VDVNAKRLTRQESQQVTRAKLVEAAEGVFVRHGFDAASVEQIAEAAGFSRGAFYSNFQSKDEIFLALLDRKYREIECVLNAIFREKQSARGRFRAARDWYAGHWQERTWTVLKAEFNLRAMRRRSLGRRLSALWWQEVETISAILTQYFSEAGLTPGENPRSIAVSLMAAAEGIGMFSLVPSEAAFASVVAGARTLVFDRLVPAPPARARRARKEYEVTRES
jgi:AcrR family transcriptional regulator